MKTVSQAQFNVSPRRPRLSVNALAITVFFAALFTITMSSHATQEPTYKIVRTLADIEVRAYAAYTVAETVVPGPSDEAGNQAFPILAGYIFGKNKGERKLAMTAPVTQTAAPIKLAMTAPVTQSAALDGFLVQFVLPSDVSLATAPEPLDARVTLREISPAKVAVIRFSGFWSESNYNEHLEKLKTAARSANLVWLGEPVYSRYNAPYTPWFMRRNEIWLRLADAP